MENPSRRRFFGGKAPEISQWDQLLLQLQRKTQGTLSELQAQPDSVEEQAVFRVSALTDLHLVRQYCTDFNACLGLWANESSQYHEQDTPVVWVDMGALNQLTPINADKTQWFMQAGVKMAQLKEAGFSTFEALPDDLLIAQWLAEPSYHGYAPLQLSQSGLVHGSLLTAEGSINSLGAFGENNTKPLHTAFLQRVVPKLFELASSEIAQALLQQPNWIGGYRFDAFDQKNTAINIAHILLGHQGKLGAVEWVVLDKNQLVLAIANQQPIDNTMKIAAQELDAAIKQLFDPDMLFV